VALLVRTWNVFHGNASPPERRSFLKEIVQLATEDDPDVLCLQELPVWALGHLDAWSGMRSFGAVAARPLLGSAELGRVIRTAAAIAATAGTASTSVRRQVNRRGGAGAPATI